MPQTLYPRLYTPAELKSGFCHNKILIDPLHNLIQIKIKVWLFIIETARKMAKWAAVMVSSAPMLFMTLLDKALWGLRE